MARPKKGRNVCSLPERNRFGPPDSFNTPGMVVNMTVDEYEAIRLIDLEGLTQAECSVQMGVARTTVQGIYASARVKLAESLVEGKLLTIEGGDYQLCNGLRKYCGKKCNRPRHRRWNQRRMMEDNYEDSNTSR